MPQRRPRHEVEHAAGVPAGEQDREPGHDYGHQRRDIQEEQHNIVRDGRAATGPRAAAGSGHRAASGYG